jgi:beta-lactamase superfamily II metal-dependent hydrolase
MRIQIFDVEHGACNLITADTGVRVLIDCGHNATTGWRPSVHLRQNGITTIAQLAITNYDEDHVSDLPNLLRVVRPGILTRNPTVSPDNLKDLKSEQGAGQGIERLIDMAREFSHPVTSRPELGEIRFSYFCNNYPADFDDENNLSLAVFLHYREFCMLFPGDMERAGWLKLLERPDFVTTLKKTRILVASHHGRANGCCEEMFELGWKPQIVIMSDAGIQFESQASAPWYAARSEGIRYGGEYRSVFTTRRDKWISLEVTPVNWSISTGREESRVAKALFG